MNFYFYSPVAFEKWDYRNPVEQGIGGSETAHIEMALRLAKRGHKVISYSPLPKDCPDPDFGGVSWLDLTEVDYKAKGIWVISRFPKLANKFPWVSHDQQLWLVMQDEAYKDLKNLSIISKFDLLLPLCSEHVRLVNLRYQVSKTKVIQSSNGLRPDLVKKVLAMDIERNPNKLVYASSPDRGLFPLLKIFKKAREMDPELELHVFYGFNNIEKYVKSDRLILGKDDATLGRLKSLLEQPGVFWKGRINQIELYKEWASAGIWAYPTNFFETSCITSMEAQALGAIPITAPIGALADNVRYGIMIPGDANSDPLTWCRYAYQIVKVANDIEAQNKIRPAMMKEAVERFSWENIVDQYEDLAMGKESKWPLP